MSEQRQRTGSRVCVPAILSVLMTVIGTTRVQASNEPGLLSASSVAMVQPDLREDGEWDEWMEWYLGWLLEQLGAPPPPEPSVNALMAAVVEAYDQRGMPEVAPEEREEFLTNLVAISRLLDQAPNPDKSLWIERLKVIVAEMTLILGGLPEREVGA